MNVDKLFLKSVKNGNSLRLHPGGILIIMGICVKHTLCYEDFDNCKTYIIFLKLFKSNKTFKTRSRYVSLAAVLYFCLFFAI